MKEKNSFKFRAWDNKRKLMIDEVVVIDLYHEYIGYLYPSQIVQGEIVSRLPINDVIIMQSTGLFDKNGVEIFEGDVIVDHLIKGLDKVSFVVVKCDNYLYPKMIRNGIIYNNIIDPMLFNQHAWLNGIEVVGNIYENKDLLGVENE